MTPLERAEAAKYLLEDRVFNVAMEDLRADLVASLEGIPAENHEAQHEAVLMLKTLVRLRQKLHGYTEELLKDKQKLRDAEWFAKARETITDLMPPRRVR